MTLSNKWLLSVLFILWAFVIVAIWEGIESLFFSPDIVSLHQPDPRRTGVCAFPENLASSMELPVCNRDIHPDNIEAITDLATGKVIWHQWRYSCVHFDDDGGKITYVKKGVC